MKQAVISIGLLVAALICYVAVGPFITVYEIKAGIENRDSEKLTDYIDFTTLRANIKDQLNAYLMQQMSTELKGNPFGALGIAIGGKLVEGMVDSFVTPIGLSNLAGGRTPQEASNHSQPLEPFKNARYIYDSWSRFSVWVTGEGGREARFVLTRYGLSWKLSNIVVPDLAGLLAGQRTPESAAPGVSLTPAPSVQNFLKIETIDTRVTEANDVWARYAWKLSVLNAGDESAQFNARIQWQDADGFVVDDDEEYGLSLSAHETQTFTGDKLISYPAASRVKQIAANISR